MNSRELATCLIRLQAAFPGEWGEPRQHVWADHLAPLDFTETNNALRRMEATTNYLTVAALYEALRAGPDAGIHPTAELLTRTHRNTIRDQCQQCAGDGVLWDHTGAVTGLCQCQS